MAESPYTLYGRSGIALPNNAGKVFFVVGTAGVDNQAFQARFLPDADGVQRVYSTVPLALAQTVPGRGDVIFMAPDYVTALTAADILLAETNNVAVVPMAGFTPNSKTLMAFEPTKVLPASTTGSIFTITGRVKLLAIIGQVTTVIQTQADNLKITNTPTVGSAVDLCSVLNVSALAVGTQLSIDGVLADALIATNGAYVAQAGAINLKAGTLDLITSATNTGSVKWTAIYEQIDPGAMMVAI